MKDFKDRLGRDLEHLESEIVALGSYEVEQINDLKELNGVGLVIRHTKTWARFSVVLNDDDNKVFAIGFRTPPSNSKGIQTIIAHTATRWRNLRRSLWITARRSHTIWTEDPPPAWCSWVSTSTGIRTIRSGRGRTDWHGAIPA